MNLTWQSADYSIKLVSSVRNSIQNVSTVQNVCSNTDNLLQNQNKVLFQCQNVSATILRSSSDKRFYSAKRLLKDFNSARTSVPCSSSRDNPVPVTNKIGKSAIPVSKRFYARKHLTKYSHFLFQWQTFLQCKTFAPVQTIQFQWQTKSEKVLFQCQNVSTQQNVSQSTVTSCSSDKRFYSAKRLLQYRQWHFPQCLSLIHIWRCRRSTLCRSRWSPYH